MHNPHMDGSKVTNQIFDVLPRRCLRYLSLKIYSKLGGRWPLKNIVNQEKGGGRDAWEGLALFP